MDGTELVAMSQRRDWYLYYFRHASTKCKINRHLRKVNLIMDRDFIGNESEEFWGALGGKTEYSSVKDTGVALGFEPRLFHASNKQGYFYV